MKNGTYFYDFECIFHETYLGSILVNKRVNEGSTKAEKEKRVTSVGIIRYACGTSLYLVGGKRGVRTYTYSLMPRRGQQSID